MPSSRLTVRVTPRAARDEVAGFEDGVLRVRVTAAPVDGRANRALERLLAKRLGVPNSAVSVVVGHTGRRKVVEVEGLGRRRRAAASRMVRLRRQPAGLA